MKEMVGGCCVCSDERGWPDNPLVYCDGNGCTVAVHQACYGIVTVPTGPWYCRKCESPETKGKVKCELCPSRSGALKKADTGGWAHVVCALYIPEVRFGNVTSMEPIVLRLIPPERFTRTCYICTENGKSHRAGQGACMACNKSGCKQQFHVTCAQSLGLLCEEAGNYLDNVKYCGYCQHHYAKLKKGGNVKTIPPYKPVAHDSQSSGSSSEKEGGASPVASGSGTPTPHTKGSKGPGRKPTQNKDTSKNSPASKGATATTPQPMEKKKSPSRRQSSASDGAGSSKTTTPSPSPSHSSDLAHSSKTTGAGGSGSRSSTPAALGSAGKSPQSSSVISSVASAVAAVTSASPPRQTTSTGIIASVVQATPTKLTVTFQESVIINTDAIETKHTKKRKAAAAAATAAAEQAAQASANEPATSVEPEQKQTKKRKAVAAFDAQSTNGLKAGTETPPNSNEPVLMDLETRHTKKRKAAAAAAAAAAESPVPISSPINVDSPILVESANPPDELQPEPKQTKKRRAAAVAAAHKELALAAVVSDPMEFHTQPNEPLPGPSGMQWEHGQANDSPVPMDTSDKTVKKVRTDSMTPPPAHYMNTPTSLLPPPSLPTRSPRHMTSPLPGPSGMHPPASAHPPTTIRSPSHLQAQAQRARRPSLIVSVLLSSAGYTRYNTTGPQYTRPQASAEMPAPPSSRIFHQPQKPPTAMESGIPAHSPHGQSQRSTWTGLINYEMHQESNKPSISGVPGSSKDLGGVPMQQMTAMPPMPPAMRNKKRAAMAAASMVHQPTILPSQNTILSTQSLASVRRHAPLSSPHPQPQIYQDPARESPPPSPTMERQLKARAEQQYYSKLLTTAPHMLGNELNPESGAAARLQEQLNAELAAHAVGAVGPDPIIPPPLINKAAPGASGRSTGAQSLDQLLERQWEQGSQFLMEQAQHFDIASLLSCLHQLRTENVRLEEHVGNLLQRRDHLLAVNARLAIPLSAASAPPSESARCSRESVASIRAPLPPPPALPRPADVLVADRHVERQLAHHQLVMREVQQKPS